MYYLSVIFFSLSFSVTAQVLTGYDAPIKSLRSSGIIILDDQKTVLCVTAQACLYQADLIQRKVTQKLKLQAEKVDFLIVLSGQKTFVTISTDTLIRYWSIKNEQEILKFKADHPIKQVLVVDEYHLITLDAEGVVCGWDLQEGRNTFKFEWHMTFWTKWISFSTNKQILLATSLSGVITRIDLRTKESIQYFDTQHLIDRVALPFDDQTIIVGSTRDSMIRQYNLSDESLMKRFYGHERGVKDIIILKDQRHFISTDNYNELKYWDLKEQKLVCFIKLRRQYIWKITPLDGQPKVLLLLKSGKVKLWDLNSGEIVQQFKGNTYASTNFILAQGGKSIFMNHKKSIKHYDLETGRILGRIREKGLKYFQTLPALNQLITADDQGHISIWDMNTYQKNYVLAP